jgi:diaminopimelate epimerase
MQLEFTKMHGLGNDFIVFDAPKDGRLPTADQWRALAARHTGIGFDQALVLEAPRRGGTQVYYRIFNADGGEVEQCGNGVRCLASFLHRRGALPSNPGDGGEIVLDSPPGLIRARVHDANLVSVDITVPK